MVLLNIKWPKTTLFALIAFMVIFSIIMRTHDPYVPHDTSIANDNSVRDASNVKPVYTEEQFPQSMTGMNMEDPRLISYIRKFKMQPPSAKPYNLDHPEISDYSQFRQSRRLDRFMRGKRNGFFVEAGAQEGERISNTLFFEKERNWTGLLVEMDPVTYKILESKNRKSYVINGCLSLTKESANASFKLYSIPKRINDRGVGVTVDCYPLYSMMMAIGRTTIDLFSLDIEGHELKVLKTIPWEKLQIKILNVEMNHVQEGAQALRDYIESVGYTYIEKHNIDFVFMKTEFLHELDLDANKV